MLVVDTSVAIKWVVPEDGIELEPDTGVALSLLERGLIAPDLLIAEFGNALWKKVRRGEILAEHARQSAEILPTIVTLLPAGAYAGRALELALELDHPIYDCFFLAVAEAQASPLVTADRRLMKQCAASLYAPLLVDLATEAWR